MGISILNPFRYCFKQVAEQIRIDSEKEVFARFEKPYGETIISMNIFMIIGAVGLFFMTALDAFTSVEIVAAAIFPSYALMQMCFFASVAGVGFMVAEFFIKRRVIFED